MDDFSFLKDVIMRNSDVSGVVALIASPLLASGIHVHLHLFRVTWSHTWVQRRFSVLKLHSYFISHLHRLLVDVIGVLRMLVINFVVSVGSLIVVVWVRDIIFAVEFRVFVDILRIGFIVGATVSWMTGTEKNCWMLTYYVVIQIEGREQRKIKLKTPKDRSLKTKNFKKIIEHESLVKFDANYNFFMKQLLITNTCPNFFHVFQFFRKTTLVWVPPTI